MAPNSFTILPHFVASDWIDSANRVGDLGWGCAACSLNNFFTSGSAGTAMSDSFRFLTTAGGVPARASRPNQEVAL